MRKRDMTPLGKKGQLVKNQGKGAVEQRLPNAGAMQTLTQGDPMSRTMNDYAKQAQMPMPDASPSIGTTEE